LALIMWGRMASCGGLAIRLGPVLNNLKADCQSAAGYQPASQSER
jgi:hypothetical protein